MGEDCDGKCRDQFPGYQELVQKRKLVCGLARSVIRCFLGSGVLPPDAHCTLSLRYVYRGNNINPSNALVGALGYRCSSHIFLSSRPRTRICNRVYYWVWLRPDRMVREHVHTF